MNMKVFVLGCGSIGRRHIANLLTLGVEDVLAYDPVANRRGEIEDRFGIPTVDTIEQGWKASPNAVLIAASTSMHVPLAIEAAERGCHLFIEKPLGHCLDGVDELLSTVTHQKLIALVGCNMRFHHGPSTIKRLLDQHAIGRVISAIIDTGQYLPDWHPDEDYRSSYSANASLGGGVVLDAIHEIDYARWLFGEVTEVSAQGGKLSSLEIDTEDTANILMKTVAGPSVFIHLDYLQRASWRSCKVVGEEGTILWDINQAQVQMYSARDGRWHQHPEPEGYTINQMYLDELEHFMRCLGGEEKPSLGLIDAKRVLELALAIKDSMRTGDRQRVAA